MRMNMYYTVLSMIIIILFLILLPINQTAESENLPILLINEVMYDPKQDDTYNEWVELYNPTNKSINVSGWILIDNFSNDTIEADTENGNGSTVILAKGYAIIADHGTGIYENYSIANDTIKLSVDDLNIGNGLGNLEDKLILQNNNGTVIDAMEWGADYADVAGYPAALVDVNHSLSRFYEIDTNDSSIDFFDGVIPTPGKQNIVVISSHLQIDSYPCCIAKIQNNSDYSIPFAIKVNMTNFSYIEQYQLKAYVVGNCSHSYPATQIWDGERWQYSYYFRNITTDQCGNWSDWLFLRFNRDYQEYQNYTMYANFAYLVVKVQSENISREISKKISLLDMDESTTHATNGGYAIGIAQQNTTIFNDTLVVITNNTGMITGIYVTEDNRIDESFIHEPGYYKIPSPVGTYYSIHFINDDQQILHSLSNITIIQGDYDIDAKSPSTSYQMRRQDELNISLTITNTGDFPDNFTIDLGEIQNGWTATLNQTSIYLNPGETSLLNLHILPCQHNSCRQTMLTIISTSEHDIAVNDTLLFTIDILSADLTITKSTCYDMSNQKNTTFGEGEIIKIKAHVKNIGNDNATNVTVSFYYDTITKNHFIGSKYYETIATYQKYPSIYWDTLGINCGNHTLFIVVDENDTVEEFDETNNIYTINIEIYNTFPPNGSKTLVITQVYYHTHPTIKNEFLVISNPTTLPIDISGWYLTNKQCSLHDDTKKIAFPDNTTLLPKSNLYVTQNASAFQRETGKTADFEYTANSRSDIRQMHKQKNLTLSNTQGIISLKDPFNHSIDVVVYGAVESNVSGWIGPPIPPSGSGVILKRNHNNGIPLDTNTSSDWIHPRIYGIGQSDFPYVTLFCSAEIKTFVSPDCSYTAICSELRNASDSIYFNIYEFTNPFLCDELVAALHRGVAVHIFLEGAPIGGIDDREKYILNRIINNGGKVRFIVNDPARYVDDRYRFDHGKYLVIDNHTVIVESCNWVKTGIPIDPSFGNREWGVIVRNTDVAAYFLSVFLDDWNPLRCDSYSSDDMDLSIPPDFYPSDMIYTGSYVPQFQSKTVQGNFSITPVFSPDTSEQAIIDLISSAKTSIFIEQLYIYKNWTDMLSPFVEQLVNKSQQGVDIKVILNYNPGFMPTNIKQNQTKHYFEQYGIEVRFHYTNWSYFTNVHNKGMIVDNSSVLISSINWNENSVKKNREAGIIIENQDIALYYADVFYYDWNLGPPIGEDDEKSLSDSLGEYKNKGLIVVIYAMTFALVGRDWRKRKWNS